ncbi:hypothetical protein ACH4C6_19375 [Streptomyces sp. NPDC017943]|uniref:hypothetical protein n=1 Tax=Streptomyces sp. NPDC017943 TaxID=3365019 RepID=UPI00378B338E
MITPEQIKDLLESDADDPVLVVVSGAAAVVPASALETDDYRGALEIASRKDLLTGLDGEVPSGHELEEIAARLDASVTRLGA